VLKFPLTGTVESDVFWRIKAIFAGLLALLPMLFFVRRFAHWGTPAVLFFAAALQLSCSLMVWSATLPLQFYLAWYDWLALLLLLPAQLAIVAVFLANAFEFSEIVLARGLRRRFELLPGIVGPAPKVSLHLACSNEPPEMVIATLDSLAELDYPNFEVLVVDNNTRDPALWEPVQAHVQALGARFRFFSLGPWPGFKSGALNFALEHTASDASIIGVVDSDYVVAPNWLRQTVGYFADPKVGFVQLPQAHREFQSSAFRAICNYEYEGFFRIGMHHRHERDAIIMHGTMTLIRRAPLVADGGWAQWCICEDAELGLRLYRDGFSSVYVDEKLGRGLTPADIAAFKSQRFRWAFGAMQILRRHWRWVACERRLSMGQRAHFLTGWFSWFADALHAGFSMLAIAWTVGMLLFPRWFDLPLPLYLIPVLGLFVFKAAFGLISYAKRVDCNWWQSLGAAVAAMALSHTIARGVVQGLTAEKPVFNRTAKKRRINAKPSTWGAVREELFMLAGLLAAIVGVALLIGWENDEALLWTAVLAVQAIPYASAMGLALVASRVESP
jgi:glycosyltransferase involved in cell wall biosynthesis